MKQRLVGTLVLGSLALILIPLLLDGEGVERPPLSATTPPAPLIDTTPLPEPTRPEIFGDLDDSPFELVEMDEAPLDAEDAPAAGNVERSETAVASVAGEDAPAASRAPASTASTPAVTATPPAPANNVAATSAPRPAQAEPAPRSVSTPALDASGLPEAWTVRLGSFGNRANADALVARLTAAGHKAYIRPLQTSQGTLSGVFVGPVATRNEASALQAELKSRFQINDAIVQRYNIAQ